MNIKHRPIYEVDNLAEYYSKKDGVPVKYVCTSAIQEQAAFAADVFFRETPHPEFGNRYFALYPNLYSNDAQVMIANADKIEDLEFNMLEAGGQWHYSQHRHDYYETGNGAIDGGRAYFRASFKEKPNVKTFRVKDGEFEIYKATVS